MASFTAAAINATGSYYARQRAARAVKALNDMRQGVEMVNAVVPGVVPTDLQALLARYPYSYDRTPECVVECAYCGRKRSKVLATHACKGCGAQETK